MELGREAFDVKGSPNVLHTDICEDAYTQVERMIHKLCWHFQSRYGGDPDEWLSEAHMLFMECMESHNNTIHSAMFITWVWNRITWGFRDILRRRIKDSQRGNPISIEQLTSENIEIEDLLLPGAKKTHPCLMSLVESASDPVRELWSIINYPPPDLIDDLNPEAPEESWDALQRYCMHSLCWTYTTMQAAIAELKDICSA